MKISARHQMHSQLQTKKQGNKSKTAPEIKETLQPMAMSSYTNIPLKKTKKDILVAENDEMSIIVIKAILDKHNFSYELVTNETEAISALEKNHFHIALTGINDKNNLWENLIKKVWEENRDMPKTFLLALTNLQIQSSISEYLNNNFDKIILKPYKEAELIKIIRKYKKLTPKRKTPLNQQSFNLDQLRRISNNNEEFVRNMLDKFIQSAVECRDTMNTALTENNMDKLKKAAHKGLPSYSVLELKDLTELLIYIDHLSLSDQINITIKKKVLDFEKLNSNAINEIRKYLEIS